MSATRFFACPKKSNKRKGTTQTNHRLGLGALAALLADQPVVRTLRGQPPTGDGRENGLEPKLIAN
jgi:hypothetical protein